MPIPNGQTDIVKILFGKKIAESSDAEIQETLLKTFVLVGLRMQHYPDKLHNQFLINYIRKEYAHKTIDELQLAFELAIKQELDIDDCKVYDNFSIEYLVRIMNGYRFWLINENKKLVKINDIEVDVVITERDKLNDINTYLNRYDLHLRNLHFIPLYIYQYMIELKLINQSDKQKSLMYKRSLQLFEEQLSIKASSLDKSDIYNYNQFMKEKHCGFIDISDIYVVQVENVYKRLSVLDYIKNYQKEINEK
jgi:hypothetical protein